MSAGPDTKAPLTHSPKSKVLRPRSRTALAHIQKSGTDHSAAAGSIAHPSSFGPVRETLSTHPPPPQPIVRPYSRTHGFVSVYAYAPPLHILISIRNWCVALPERPRTDTTRPERMPNTSCRH